MMLQTIGCSCLILVFFATPSFALGSPPKQQISIEQRLNLDKEAALNLAKEKGWVILQHTTKGSAIELLGIREGVPLYATTFSQPQFKRNQLLVQFKQITFPITINSSITPLTTSLSSLNPLIKTWKIYKLHPLYTLKKGSTPHNEGLYRWYLLEHSFPEKSEALIKKLKENHHVENVGYNTLFVIY